MLLFNTPISQPSELNNEGNMASPRIFDSSVLMMIIFYLMFFMCHHGNGSREVSGGGYHRSRMMNMGHDNSEASKKGLFSKVDDLYVGKTLPILLPTVEDPSSPSFARFLPREVADRVPFSSAKLPQLLQLFSISDGSDMAKEMKRTLKSCEMKPITGEAKFCATSLESMLDFVRAVLGVDKPLNALTSTHVRKLASPPVLQNYTLVQASKPESKNMVACHLLTYPYAVFYCHKLLDTMIVKALAVGEDGDEIKGVFVCHLDTSEWNPKHPSFRVLGLKLGAPVCHLFPVDNYLWVSE